MFVLFHIILSFLAGTQAALKGTLPSLLILYASSTHCCIVSTLFSPCTCKHTGREERKEDDEEFHAYPLDLEVGCVNEWCTSLAAP
jgi:hypothetical protein